MAVQLAQEPLRRHCVVHLPLVAVLVMARRAAAALAASTVTVARPLFTAAAALEVMHQMRVVVALGLSPHLLAQAVQAPVGLQLGMLGGLGSAV